MILGTLPVTYRAHRAWVTSELFIDWLNKVNNMMILQKCKILIFVDSCSTHPTVELTIMKLKFFPPNTTSHLQPCGAGITQTLKAHYHCHLLHHILQSVSEVANASELAKKVNILDALLWARLAWEQVTPKTIQKCFTHCGFGSTKAEVVDLPPPDQNSDELMDGTELVDYVDTSRQIYCSKHVVNKMKMMLMMNSCHNLLLHPVWQSVNITSYKWWILPWHPTILSCWMMWPSVWTLCPEFNMTK